jgi:hypothetical protein
VYSKLKVDISDENDLLILKDTGADLGMIKGGKLTGSTD